MARTLADMIAATGKEVLEHLDRSAEIPAVTTVGAQGDVLVVRTDSAEDATTPMPSCLVVVRSEISNNRHTLHPDGLAYWRPATSEAREWDQTILGVVTIPAGSEVFLSHQEHGGLLLGEGTFELRRQAELGRLIAD